MQTHLDLIYDQLDLLNSFLVEATGALYVESIALSVWKRDDVHELIQQVDCIAEQYLTVSQRLVDGDSMRQIGTDLLAPLQAVKERSAALLYDDTLSSTLSMRLQQINSTGSDMFSIVREIFDL